MEAEIKWLDNPEIFRVNQLAAHSDHTFYESEEAYDKGESALLQSLDGKWRFAYSENSKVRPVSFYEVSFNDEAFDTIQVPGHIELSGYDKIHYINTMYPWEGHIFRRPAYIFDEMREGIGCFSEAAYNPVGSYRKCFDLDEGLREKRVCIRFEGVEEALYVWLNGHFVGYAEDSFTPSEFDLTPYIKAKGNILAVEVHKRSTVAYLEDQDFFRFFGIFRSVILYAKPVMHIEDIWIKPVLQEDNVTGQISADIKISAKTFVGKVKMILCDKDGSCILEKEAAIDQQVCFMVEKIEQVSLWDYHNPYLYTLIIELWNETNHLVEIVPYQVGFRRIEIKDKLILLNGKRLILNGVNRHEWNANSGRCITIEDMQWDIECLMRNNINAVRTSHYPSQIPWYTMCDQHGIYVMAETNLESHGSWQKMGAIEPLWNVPGSHPKWKDAVLDRAKTNFETFKNHPCVLFWSLGNESYAGNNLLAMHEYFKKIDPSRLVHYEGVYHNPKYKDTISDVESRMYATPQEIRAYLENEPKKPFILCEYMHDMGNSLGGMKCYIDLIDQYEMYQGGFIWDYIDQALWVEDEITGKMVLRYGGDFDDRPSDYEFSGNGIVFANRTEKPAIQEVSYYYGLYK